MPDLIDSMVMKITLDPASFRAGEMEVAKLQKALRDDATKTAVGMEASGKQAAMFFADAKREALGLLGTLVGAGGLAAFAAKSTASLATLGREARNIGVSVRELSAFQNVIERNGGSAESATQSLRGFTDQMERLKTIGDNQDFAKFLPQIGADRSDTAVTAFMKFMRFVETHKNDIPLIRLIGKGLGFDEGLVNTAIQIGSVTAATRQLADEMGRVATPDQVDAAGKLQKAWFDLEHQAKYTGDTILTDLNKPLVDTLTTIQELLKNKEIVTMISGIAVALIGLTAIRLGGGFLAWLFGSPATAMAATAALKGDTAPDFGTPPGGAFFGEHGAVANWWQRNMPTWMGGGPGGAPPTSGNAAEVARRTHDFWRSQGFTEDQTAGILAGGPGAESRFNPAAIGDNGTSYGLYQHHGERWAAMQQRYGTKYPSEAQQNEFAAWEISPNGPLSDVGRRLHATPKAGEVTMVWTSGFEKPADPGAGMKRARNAAGYIGLYDANPSNMPPIMPTPPPPPRVDPSLQLAPGGGATTSGNTSTDNSSTVHIGSIAVHGATDAAGVARDLRGQLDDVMGSGFVPMANRGLQ